MFDIVPRTCRCAEVGKRLEEPDGLAVIIYEILHTQSPATVAESFAKYDAVRAELIAVLEAKMPGISWSVDKPATLVRSEDGGCILNPQTMKSNADVVALSNRFADIFAAGDPVLAKHGFPAFGGTDPVPGGWVVARSTDSAGATLSIESKEPGLPAHQRPGGLHHVQRGRDRTKLTADIYGLSFQTPQCTIKQWRKALSQFEVSGGHPQPPAKRPTPCALRRGLHPVDRATTGLRCARRSAAIRIRRSPTA